MPIELSYETSGGGPIMNCTLFPGQFTSFADFRDEGTSYIGFTCYDSDDGGEVLAFADVDMLEAYSTRRVGVGTDVLRFLMGVIERGASTEVSVRDYRQVPATITATHTVWQRG